MELLALPLSNCTVQLISAITWNSVGKNLSMTYMLRNNLLDLVMIRNRLGSGDEIVEETNVIGRTT